MKTVCHSHDSCLYPLHSYRHYAYFVHDPLTTNAIVKAVPVMAGQGLSISAAGDIHEILKLIVVVKGSSESNGHQRSSPSTPCVHQPDCPLLL